MNYNFIIILVRQMQSYFYVELPSIVGIWQKRNVSITHLSVLPNDVGDLKIIAKIKDRNKSIANVR